MHDATPSSFLTRLASHAISYTIVSSISIIWLLRISEYVKEKPFVCLDSPPQHLPSVGAERKSPKSSVTTEDSPSCPFRQRTQVSLGLPATRRPRCPIILFPQTLSPNTTQLPSPIHCRVGYLPLGVKMLKIKNI